MKHDIDDTVYFVIAYGSNYGTPYHPNDRDITKDFTIRVKKGVLESYGPAGKWWFKGEGRQHVFVVAYVNVEGELKITRRRPSEVYKTFAEARQAMVECFKKAKKR